MRRAALISLGLTLSLCLPSKAVEQAADYESADTGREAYMQAFTTLDGQARAEFNTGRALARQPWVIAPSPDSSEVEGLGPLYNRISCLGCHTKNGRGSPPENGGVLRSMVLQMGIDAKDENGGPAPHPVYGEQLASDAVPGVPAEGKVRVDWEMSSVMLADGTSISLRKPKLTYVDLGYGPIGDEARTSLRNAQPMFGLGLLEAVPDAAILARACSPNSESNSAKRTRSDSIYWSMFSSENRPHFSGTCSNAARDLAELGIHGHANRVFDRKTQTMVLGRFGQKANQPSLEQQVAHAFSQDLGVTSALYPAENCTAVETACLAVKDAKTPELQDKQMAVLLAYLRGLAVPLHRAPKDADEAAVIAEGATLFKDIGCSACHLETLPITPGVPGLPPKVSSIHAYTDLLLHDMGEGLADGRRDFAASGQDWRTPPLWGLGLAASISETPNFLHDGRAKSPLEAILWHGGEAALVAHRFEALSRSKRAALLRFLDTL